MTGGALGGWRSLSYLSDVKAFVRVRLARSVWRALQLIRKSR